MLKRYIQPTLYTVIALLYLCLGDIFHNNQTLTTPIHALYLALTSLYVFLCFFKCKLNKAMKALAVLYFLHLGYGLIFYILGFGQMVREVDPEQFIITYFNSMSAVFVFYYFSEKGMLSKNWFVWIAAVFLVVVFFQHHFYQIREAAKESLEIGDFTNNSGYYFLAVFPAAVFWKKKPIALYIAIIYLSVMILICAKRGAIIIAGIVDIYLIYKLFKTSRRKVLMIISSLVLIIGLYLVIGRLIATSEIFNARIQETIEGNYNNRDLIYKSIWDYYITESSIMGCLIGNGPYAASRLCGTMAHNDWLEIALSMGVLGILIYVNYWYAQIRIWKKARKKGIDETILLALTCVIMINFLKTFFSMSLDDMMIYTTSVMGFCFSQCNIWNITKETDRYEKN